jgi:hypothetical protein
MLSPFRVGFRRSLNAIATAESLPLLLPAALTTGNTSGFRAFSSASTGAESGLCRFGLIGRAHLAIARRGRGSVFDGAFDRRRCARSLDEQPRPVSSLALRLRLDVRDYIPDVRLSIPEETTSADPQEEGRAMSEMDDDRALNDDELDVVVAGTGEWWEGLTVEYRLNDFCN